jgi:hypothetical protein
MALLSRLTSGLAAETGFVSPRQIPGMIGDAIAEPFRQLQENIRPDAMIKNLIRETGLSDIIPTFSFGLDRLFDQSTAEAAEEKKRAAEEKKRAAEEKKAAAAAANTSNSILQGIKNVLQDTYNKIASRDVETAEQIAERRRLEGGGAPIPPTPPSGPVPEGRSMLGFLGDITSIGLAAAGLGLTRLGSLIKFLGRLGLKAGPFALIAASLVALDGKDWDKLFANIRTSIDLIADGKWLEGISVAAGSVAETITQGLINIAPISEETRKEISNKLNEIDLPGKARSIATNFTETLDEIFGDQLGGIAEAVAAAAAVASLTIGLKRLAFPALLVGGVLLYGDQIRESLEKFFTEQPMPDWADPGLTAGLTTGALGAAGAAMGVRSLAQLVGAGRFAGRGALAAGLATFTIMAGNSLKDWLDDQGKLNPITDTLVNATSFTATGASLGVMFGPKGMLIGAAAGLAIGLGYSLVNWFNGVKDKQEKALQERLSEAENIIDNALAEGRDLTEEELTKTILAEQEASRAMELATTSPEKRKELEEISAKLEEARASQPLSPDGLATTEQLESRVIKAIEGDAGSLKELVDFYGDKAKDQIETLAYMTDISLVSFDKIEDFVKKLDISINTLSTPQVDIKTLGERFTQAETQASVQAVQVTSSKALADYNEAMEKMKREEEAIARRREQAASTQVPIVVNNNNVQQGGNGVAAPVGPLHTRPTESRLDDMLLGGSLGIP